MNVVAAKTEPAPLTCANPSATASSCDQGHVKLRSASAVMQRCCQPCDLATSYCEGVTVVAAPYSQNSTGTPTGTPRTDHNNCSCQYPLDKATSTHIVERSPLQYCQCKCLESSQTAQAEYPVLRNNDDQSRDSNRCLRSALEQRSTQTLLCGPHQRQDGREATCEGSVWTPGAATRMEDLHSESTGNEMAAMRLQKQLDLFDEDSLFLGRFTMLGRDQRRSGGTLATRLRLGTYHEDK